MLLFLKYVFLINEPGGVIIKTELKDKVALVTGASKGIGRSISKSLASKGINVLLAARSEELLNSLKNEIKDSGGFAKVYPVDLRKNNDILDLFKQIKNDFDQLDILVNNAGVIKSGNIIDFSMEDFDMLVDINLRAVFSCCQQALKLMIPAKKGYIINLSSVVGIKGYPKQTAYGSVKHGIMGLTKALAAEVAEHGIKVSVILPGGVDTDLIREARPDLDSSVLMQPEDIADTVLYLLELPGRAMVDQIYIRRSKSTPF
ncbi:SDR family oxidoreductase [Actinomycetota bacterium]